MNVDFVLREMGEVYWFEYLVSELGDCWVNWQVHLRPYNSDLSYINMADRLGKLGVQVQSNAVPTESAYSFISDISKKVADKTTGLIDIHELNTCIPINTENKENWDVYDVVVSNVKMNDKNPKKEYQPYMWNVLKTIWHRTAVVPRHPVPQSFLDSLEVPDNVTIINTVGSLKGLCLRAKLVVMGLIFSKPLQQFDHNPIEATQSCNAIYWRENLIEPAYIDYYGTHWLLHPFEYGQDFSARVEDLIGDFDLPVKLQKRDAWIQLQKKKIFDRIRWELKLSK